MYPLYYTLCSNIPDKEPGKKEIHTILKKIKKATPEEKTAIFFLIVEHARVEDGYSSEGKKKLPYKGKKEPENVEFDVDNLPPKLIWILSRFAKLGRE